MKTSESKTRKTWSRLFLWPLLFILVLPLTKCLTPEEQCPFPSLTKLGKFHDVLISSPISIIQIEVESGTTLNFDCIDVCYIVEIRYILYAIPKGSTIVEEIVDQGRINLGADFVDSYLDNLKLRNVPQSSNLRLVLELDTPDCGREQTEQTYEYNFTTPTFTEGTPPNNLSYNPNTAIVNGDNPQSPLPTIDPEKGPYTYLITDGFRDGISSRNTRLASKIQAETGFITFSNGHSNPFGRYSYEIAVTNSSGTTFFQNAFTFIKTDEEGNIPPSNLVYNPNNILLDGSASISSVTPTLVGSAPFTFSFENSILPGTAVSIDSLTGVITAHKLLALEYGNGTYTLNVTVQNSVGKRTFPAALTVTVDTSGGPIPSNLVYNPYLVSQTSAMVVTSSIPSLSGTPPFTFSLARTNIPASTININPDTGVITATEELFTREGPGVYIQDVIVTNTTGSVTFNNALRIDVVREVASSLEYNPNIITQISNAAVSSVVPAVSGGEGPYTFSITNDVPGTIIDPNSGVITATETLALEYGNGTYTVNVGVANSSGVTAFVNAFTVIVSGLGSERRLVYSPNNTTISMATATTSPAPTVTGMGNPPFTFTLNNGSALPNPGITINSQTGVIATTAAFASTFGNNTYQFDVYVTNGTDFYIENTAYTLTVDLAGGEEPSNLNYNPNTVTQASAAAVSSPTPTVAGPPPFTFSIENSNIPASVLISALSIDPNTGIITANPELFTEWGGRTFVIDVGVTNITGSVTFPDAFTIEVPLVEVVYNPSSISITTVTAITSVTPTVTGLGAPPFTFAIENADALNAPISIDPNTGVISATDILSLEFNNNSYHVNVRVTNSAGTTHTQNDAYTIFVNR